MEGDRESYHYRVEHSVGSVEVLCRGSHQGGQVVKLKVAVERDRLQLRQMKDGGLKTAAKVALEKKERMQKEKALEARRLHAYGEERKVVTDPVELGKVLRNFFAKWFREYETTWYQEWADSKEARSFNRLQKGISSRMRLVEQGWVLRQLRLQGESGSCLQTWKEGVAGDREPMMHAETDDHRESSEGERAAPRYIHPLFARTVEGRSARQKLVEVMSKKRDDGEFDWTRSDRLWVERMEEGIPEKLRWVLRLYGIKYLPHLERHIREEDYEERGVMKHITVDSWDVLLSYSDAGMLDRGGTSVAGYGWKIGGLKGGPSVKYLVGGGPIKGDPELLSSTRAEHIGVLACMIAIRERSSIGVFRCTATGERL